MNILEAFRQCWFIATFGCILIIAGTSILYWNEGRAVHTNLSLDEALQDSVSIDPTEDLENDYEGRIVHIVGSLIIGEPLTEPDYNIQVQAVKLNRRVQMYQWVEESVEHRYGGSVSSVETDTRTYYYVTEWRDDIVDSRSFFIQGGHRNPDHFPIESLEQIADAVFVGKYELGDNIKKKFNNYIEVTSDERPEDSSVKLHLGLYYHSNDIFNPEVGDIRILFSFAGREGETFTIVGKLEKNKIVSYTSSRGIDILFVHAGELSAPEVFKLEHQTQRKRTWSYRFIGWALVFFGVTCTSTLLTIILSRIQFLSVLAPDPEFPAGANIVLSFSMALVIASVAWILHRPMIGAGLFFAAASPFVWCARGVANYQRVFTN